MEVCAIMKRKITERNWASSEGKGRNSEGYEVNIHASGSLGLGVYINRKLAANNPDITTFTLAIPLHCTK